MTTLDVITTPGQISTRDLRDSVVAVIDVLRATTTMAMALAQGAEGIIPVAEPEQAFAVRDEQPQQRTIGGERGGRPLPGFDLGNSPREYVQGVVQNKQIVLTTTNGTKALLACREANAVWIGSFVNRQACARAIHTSDRVYLLCSGKEGRFCLEDTVCAGAIVEVLRDGQRVDASDSAEAAHILYERWKENIEGLLYTCEHGRYLASLGLSEDLRFCAQLDSLDVNGSLQDGMVRRIESGWSASEVG